jgi:hypothetical protein
MEDTGNIQVSFLAEVKKHLPPSTTFVDELAEVLQISRDSAYRRIRGETILSLTEVNMLVAHYNVPIDALLAAKTKALLFQHQAVDFEHFTFSQWLQSLYDKLSVITAYPAPNKELIYYAKDIPIFYYFAYRELSAFKMFFWMKSILCYPELENTKFAVSRVTLQDVALGERIWDQYAALPTTEIWSDETLNVTLKQILFYYESGLFENPADALVLLDQFNQLIENVRKWASKKVKPGGAKFDLYKNEILVGENTVFFKMGDQRIVFLSHNITDTLASSHQAFCAQTERFLNNLINQAPLLSGSSAKERDRFFNQMIEKIKGLKEKIARNDS